MGGDCTRISDITFLAYAVSLILPKFHEMFPGYRHDLACSSRRSVKAQRAWSGPCTLCVFLVRETTFFRPAMFLQEHLYIAQMGKKLGRAQPPLHLPPLHATETPFSRLGAKPLVGIHSIVPYHLKSTHAQHSHAHIPQTLLFLKALVHICSIHMHSSHRLCCFWGSSSKLGHDKNGDLPVCSFSSSVSAL